MIFLLPLLCLLGAAVGTWLVMTAVQAAGNTGLIIVAIVAGGICGGFTLGLVGGEKYGLKLPGKVGNRDHRYNPGVLGDIFVGLMSALVGAAFAANEFRFDIFDASKTPLVQLLFMDFGFSYLCGFLGLRLIKAFSKQVVSEDLLKETQAEVEETKAEVEETKAEVTGTSTYLSAQEALRQGQFDEAVELYKKSMVLDDKESVRALIGLGRAQRHQGQLGEAIASVDRAIELKDAEPYKGRVAVAYWNRACYKALSLDSAVDRDAELSQIFEDLRESIRLQPSYRQDLVTDADLKNVAEDDRFRAMVRGRE